MSKEGAVFSVIHPLFFQLFGRRCPRFRLQQQVPGFWCSFACAALTCSTKKRDHVDGNTPSWSENARRSAATYTTLWYVSDLPCKLFQSMFMHFYPSCIFSVASCWGAAIDSLPLLLQLGLANTVGQLWRSMTCGLFNEIRYYTVTLSHCPCQAWLHSLSNTLQRQQGVVWASIQ